MEPSTRPYNPNGPTGPTGQRAAPARRAKPAARPAQPQPKAVAAPGASASIGAAPRSGRSRVRRGSKSSGDALRQSEPGASPLVADAAEPLSGGASASALVSIEVAEAPPEGHVTDLSELSDVATPSERAAHAPGEADGDAARGPVALVGVADFEDIFTRFQTPITNFIYRLVGNREQAYDLAQDVFVKAYRALSGGATIQAGALSSWLYRIASNTATDALRRRRLISWLPLSLFNDDRGVGAGMPGVDNGFGQQGLSEEHLASAMGAFSSGYDGGRFEQRVADREIVERVLKRLPQKYAACLLLYEHEGFSCAEIADVLHVTPSAVKMRLMRARERFISIYQQEMEGRQ